MNKNTTILRIILSVSLFFIVMLLKSPIASAAAIPMKNGWYYPSEQTWTGSDGTEAGTGDPKQPYNDGGDGGRIYGYLEKDYERIVGTQHIGMDIRVDKDDPVKAVYAIADGKIYKMWKQKTSDPTFWALIVEHKFDNGTPFWAIYGHCENISGMSVGTTVKAGQRIATNKEDPNWHIHFGINLNISKMGGFGRIPIGDNPTNYGWTAPRTWMLNHKAYPPTTTPPTGEISITSASSRSTMALNDTAVITHTVKNTKATSQANLTIESILPYGTTLEARSDNGTAGTKQIPCSEATVYGRPACTGTFDALYVKWSGLTASANSTNTLTITIKYVGNGTVPPVENYIVPTGSSPLTVEAEDSRATITAPMAIGTDTNASGGKYISVPDNVSTTGGSAVYKIDATTSPGTYTLWAYCYWANGDGNSFNIQKDGSGSIALNDDKYTPPQWHWVEFSNTLNLTGKHTINVLRRENGSQLDKFILTTDGNYDPRTTTVDPNVIKLTGATPITIEAEDPRGSLTAPVAVASDTLASGGKYIWAPDTSSTTVNNAGSVEFKLDATSAPGSYYLWTWVNWTNGYGNSFNIHRDTDPAIILSTTSNYGKWQKLELTVNGASKTLSLNGSHTLKIMSRENGSKLDKILLTTNGDYTPQ